MIDRYPIIPLPVKLIPHDGSFTINASTSIILDEINPQLGNSLVQLISPTTGYNLTIKSLKEESDHSNKANNAIILQKTSQIEVIKEEGYQFQCNPNQIIITANTDKGLFYGIQTLRQLLPITIENTQKIENLVLQIPCVEIIDYPRFSWRGYMVDEGRYFLGKKIIKMLLDMMALSKLNIFHWHLCDDQGWRIESKKYPKLTEIGSKRPKSQIKGLLSNQFDENPHAGFYTQEEIKEIIQYANERFITIVPELEIPGHSLAALAAYPEFSCTGGPFEVPVRFGIKKDVYCPGKEKPFQFLQDLIDEYYDLFQMKTLHIGGDKTPRDRWIKCPDCQNRIKSEKLANEDELQVYTTNRIQQYLISKGIQMMGWNEILGANLTKDAIVQWWTWPRTRIIKYMRAEWKFVISKVGWLYFDFDHSLTPVKQLYNFDPIPFHLEPQFHQNILGLEATLWTEWIKDQAVVEWMTLPRLFALAEVGWTSKAQKKYSYFKLRLQQLVKRLEILKVYYMKKMLWNPSYIRRLIDLIQLPKGNTFKKYNK